MSYYISSFFWSTLSKVLTAIIGFLTVPLLLGLYGKADYGIIAIATSCNGYMQLLDLGMNNGTVKYYSQWKAEGKTRLIYSVAQTNITFYILISIINILGLVSLGLWGEPLFAISHRQFLTLRTCLLIIALFAVFSWVTTAFNQLLIADRQMAFTMKWQCVQSILKGLLVVAALIFNISIELYFFFLTMFVASLAFPYLYKCKHDGLIDNIKLGWDWHNFSTVLTFSLSLFALGLSQMTATQSRPILLSMFTVNGAETVTEFRIIEVIPQLIIMIGGVASAIFLPTTSEMVAIGKEEDIRAFAYKWTRLTSILSCVLCFPFVICAKEVLWAYVGVEYTNLSTWMVLWCVTVLIQIHTTPGNSLVLAYGKTRSLVVTSAISCLLSIAVNIVLCERYGVGSAVIGYFIYVVIVIGAYYVAYYKKLMQLNRCKMAWAVLRPTSLAVVAMVATQAVPDEWYGMHVWNERISLIAQCVAKTVFWGVFYMILLFLTRTLTKSMITKNNGNLR